MTRHPDKADVPTRISRLIGEGRFGLGLDRFPGFAEQHLKFTDETEGFDQPGLFLPGVGLQGGAAVFAVQGDLLGEGFEGHELLP